MCKRFWIIWTIKNWCNFIFYKIAMKYARNCECCWNTITAYTHKLNAWHVDMLWKLIQFVERNKRPAVLSELSLTPVEYSVFSKIRHFKLIFNNENWRQPTEKGLLFFQWKIQCENRSANFGKQTLSLDHEAWQTDKQGRKKVWIWDINADYKWKQRNEYQCEKPSNMKSLFSIL